MNTIVSFLKIVKKKKPPLQTYLQKGLFRGDTCILY